MKRGYAYLTVTFFLWGSMYVISKFALADIPPLTVTFYRQLLSVSLIGLLAYRKGLSPIKREDWKYFVIIGLLGYACNGIFQFQATSMMSASLSSLINSINPLFISVFASVFLHEKMGKQKMIGMLCSFIGVFMILGFDGGTIQGRGILFAFASVFVWSFSCVWMRKMSVDYSSEQVAFVGMLIGLPACAAASFVELQTKTVNYEWKSVLAVLYMAVFCSMITNLLWNISLRLLNASTCALFYPLQTFFSAILGIALLHEQLSISFLLGGTLISAGIVIGLWNRS